VIAGEALGVRGAVATHIPIEYLHFRLSPGAHHVQELPRNLNAMLYVISGAVQIGGRGVKEFHLAAFSNDGEAVEFSSSGNAEALLLAAQPIHEPVARYGPFVMNTKQELQQAFEDFRTGKMGSIALAR
jgi:quercetin 2,3-dioxygenase